MGISREALRKKLLQSDEIIAKNKELQTQSPDNDQNPTNEKIAA